MHSAFHSVTRALSDLILNNPQYSLAVVLEILRRDDAVRGAITQALSAAVDYEQRLPHRVDDYSQDGHPPRKSWDDLMLEVITTLQSTPAGMGLPVFPAVVPADTEDDCA